MISDKENKTLKNFLKQLLSFVLLSTKTPFFVLFCQSAITVKKQTQTSLWLLNNNFLYLLARKKKLLFFVHAKSVSKVAVFLPFLPFAQTKRSNNKGGQAIKKVVSFFCSFQVKQKGTVFLYCWCFFLTDGNAFVF